MGAAPEARAAPGAELIPDALLALLKLQKRLKRLKPFLAAV